MNRYNIHLLFLLFISILSKGQPTTQTIRGVVTDEASGSPIPYANVAILNMQPLAGTITDSLGVFCFSSVPIGRYDIQVSLIGYNPNIVREVMVTSAKAIFLNVSLKESVTSLNEITVKPKANKEKALNVMSMVSARMLSVDEASRYAGGFDDPARLASSFAGVASNVGNNGIVVRGNSPKSLQWKMEGVEIPNPNHFADMAALGGGGLTALSVKVLANSDFFTGAFPAEFNNALSGVFDIRLRNGNNQNHEHSFQLGLLGIEVSSEGPMTKNSRSSYLVNYRYSTLGLMSALLPENSDGTTYQDLSFRFHMPTSKAGVFTYWGIGLIDYSGQLEEKDTTLWEYNQNKEKQDVDQFMAASGLSHHYFFNNNTYLKSTLAFTIDGLDYFTQKLDDNLILRPENKIKNNNQTYVLSSFLNKKFSARHTNRTGFVATGMQYNLLLKDIDDNNPVFKTVANNQGFSTLLSAYSSSLLTISPSLTLNIGVNTQFFTLNQNHTVEPRLGFNWRFVNNQTLSFAYGLHSRIEKLYYYFNTNYAYSDQPINKNLGFTKAHHFVIGYDRNFSEYMHIKTEIYYQHLFDVPVVRDSSFSFINLQNDWFFNEKLVNNGLGRNYGIDFTLERYLNCGFYYLLTASLFNSEYRGGDNVWRNTMFNRHYLFNLLSGKEWQTGNNKQNILGVSIRMSYQGGDCYSPIDVNASIAAKDVMFDENEAFSKHLEPSLYCHFTISYKQNKEHVSHEFALKWLNATMQNEFTDFQYNYIKNRVDERRDLITIPNLSYKFEF